MKPKIIIFSTPSCSWCKKIKDYMKKNGFKYKEVDVSKDHKAFQDMVRKTNQEGVPQTWINNRRLLASIKPRLTGY